MTSQNTPTVTRHPDCDALPALDRCDICYQRVPGSIVPELLRIAGTRGVTHLSADAIAELDRVAADFMKAVGLPVDPSEGR